MQRLTATQIRLHVSEQDAATWEMLQGKWRGLSNWWVMKLRAGERWNWKKAKKTLAESRKFDPSIDQVSGKLLAEVYFRLDQAMQAFFRRVAAGEQPGFPRVRPRHQFFSRCSPAMYVQVEGQIVLLPTGGGRGKKHKPSPSIRAERSEAVPPG
jgi:putative transposase